LENRINKYGKSRVERLGDINREGDPRIRSSSLSDEMSPTSESNDKDDTLRSKDDTLRIEVT